MSSPQPLAFNLLETAVLSITHTGSQLLGLGCCNLEWAICLYFMYLDVEVQYRCYSTLLLFIIGIVVVIMYCKLIVDVEYVPCLESLITEALEKFSKLNKQMEMFRLNWMLFYYGVEAEGCVYVTVFP